MRWVSSPILFQLPYSIRMRWLPRNRSLCCAIKCQYGDSEGRRLCRFAASHRIYSSHSSRSFFDVVSACCIRLGANETTVGAERHAPLVGEFDPLQRIQISAKTPVIHCGRINPGEQSADRFPSGATRNVLFQPTFPCTAAGRSNF